MTVMRRRPLIAVSLTALMTVGARAQEPQNDPQNPRGELESLAVELDAAVRRVSQPGVEPILGSEPARGYYVPGLGAMFVVPPRSIPREDRLLALRGRPRAAATTGATAPTNDPEYAELEQLLGPEAAREYVGRRQLEEQARNEIARTARQRRHNAPQREADMRRLEQQVEAFQREAERARLQAEHAWIEITREIQQRLDGGAAGATAGTVTVGGGVAPSATAPGRATQRDPVSEEMDSPAPWRFWFGTDDPEDPRSPAQVLADVKTAIVEVLEAHGSLLHNVGPQEQVTVAVDFLPRGLFVGMQRPTRTLVVRVKKQFIDERQAGRLGADQLRTKLEINEY
jgi:hypothetical protein